MLILPVKVRQNTYALDTSRVIEVIPRVHLKEIPHTPEYVAGIFTYRGVIVPVIDLCMLLHNEPCAPLLGTRIVIVKYHGPGTEHILGLMAEQVTSIMETDQDSIKAAGVTAEAAPYLGDIITDQQEMIQLVMADALVPDALKEILFTDQKDLG